MVDAGSNIITDLASVTKIVFKCIDIVGEFINYTNLMEIDLTNVRTIGSHAFQNCSKLDNVFIPNTVTSIGFCAFSRCPLNNGPVNLFELLDELSPNWMSIGDYAFADTKINMVRIPRNVNHIGNGAFENCQSLRYVIFQDDSILSMISDFTFQNSSLMNIT